MSTALYTTREFVLLSLPGNAKLCKASDADVNDWLVKDLVGGRTFVSDFSIPEFKIGSLDTLVLQSEELAKIDTQISGSVAKVEEILAAFTESQKNVYGTISVNNVPIPEYLTNFQWQTRKFNLNNSIKELIAEISNEAFQLDTDVRASYTNYNNAKSNLAAAQRKKTGDLSVRSLHDIVTADDFITNSEYLTTVLIVVPKSLKEDFENTYETLAKNVVPQSAKILKQDDEYVLYNVHLFKKSVSSFIAACRDRKFIPREFNYSEEILEQFRQEHDSAASLEHSLRVQLVRLAKAAYSDIFVNWFHIKALRVFVESVLRYGLPPHFITKIIAVPPKAFKQCKSELMERFGYLGGNAFSKDKHGKIKRNDSSLNEYASLVDTEYEPFVLYTIQLYTKL
ncbi:HDR158Cp [Eremothecium sinecaudum]|uniref:V-type proton ATPase subunit C n=1 Tax=Eremothecium sinecaudum TaxID=45286 RepID=A0A0X8HT11_9SACH|nr:HDR158Cp [Eremothecium sinecaudum]AMD20900.1 HDR158Cp [Eremothecium sinecaudum]